MDQDTTLEAATDQAALCAETSTVTWKKKAIKACSHLLIQYFVFHGTVKRWTKVFDAGHIENVMNVFLYALIVGHGALPQFCKGTGKGNVDPK